MTRFARLFAALDQTTSTNAKIAAMREYFASATPADAAWAVFFLTGRRFTRLLSARAIGRWVAAASGLSDWLLAECHADYAALAALGPFDPQWERKAGI